MDAITDSMDRFGWLQELVMAWHAAVHVKSQTRLKDWTELSWYISQFLYQFICCFSSWFLFCFLSPNQAVEREGGEQNWVVNKNLSLFCAVLQSFPCSTDYWKYEQNISCFNSLCLNDFLYTSQSSKVSLCNYKVW